MRLRRLVAASVMAMVVLAASRTASADTFLTPYLGTTFGARFDAADPGRKLHYGAAATWLGASGVGFEIDFGYAPTFFAAGEDELFDFKSDGNLVTLMANVVFGRAGGGVQSYVSGGFGLMRTNIDGPLALLEYRDSGFGVNAGAGLRLGSGRFGLRGDLRYFRQISDLTPFRTLELGSFHLWRGTVGLSMGF